MYLQGNNFKLKVVLKSATYNKHLSTYLIISVTVVCLFDIYRCNFLNVSNTVCLYT